MHGEKVKIRREVLLIATEGNVTQGDSEETKHLVLMPGHHNL
jgi:hypothetical protein